MLRKRPALALLGVTITALATAACGTPSGRGPGATPVDGTATATGWFAYAPLSEAAAVPVTSVASTPDGSASTPSRPPTEGSATMSRDEFWAVVDRVADPDPATAANALTSQLEALTPERIVGYEKQYTAQMARANTFLHRAAAETIMGYTSQDVFVNFRTWVLYQGRTVFDAFVADPDSLAGHGPVDDEQIGTTEILELAPKEAWQTKTGRDSQAAGSGAPDDGSLYTEPTGTPVGRAELAVRFPRLTAAYAGGDPSVGPAPIRTR